MQRFLCKNQFNIFLTKLFFQLGIKWLGRYNSGTWRSPECYIGGYYWFLAVGGQERSGYGPEWALFIYIYKKNFWLWSPLETPEWVRDPGKRLKSIVEMVWGPFLVSLGHLGGSTGLRSQQFCIGFTARAAFLAIF